MNEHARVETASVTLVAVAAEDGRAVDLLPCAGGADLAELCDGRTARALVVGPDLPLAEAERAARALAPAAPGSPVLLWLTETPAGAARVALPPEIDDVVLAEPELLGRAVARHLGGVPTGAAEDLPAPFEGIVSCDPTMRQVFEVIGRVAPTPANVLILGETGTGKDLLARAVHARSGRRGPFVPVDCGAISPHLIDAELFGHEKGSFTGAERRREGLVRHASGGTLFLDEVGNLPASAQNRLLRALQERAVRPVGGSQEVEVDVRVIAATSTPLERAVIGGGFREDLLYRLDVIRLVAPPLRERPSDVLCLFELFRRRFGERYAAPPAELAPSFRLSLLDHVWPGNVRELENLAERVVLTRPSGRLTALDFRSLSQRYEPPQARKPAGVGEAVEADGGEVADDRVAIVHQRVDLTRPLRECLDVLATELERRYLEAALERHHGIVQEAAASAGISRRTLQRLMRKHGLDKKDFR